MSSESSLIAKKIRDLVIIQNKNYFTDPYKKEPGIAKNMILIAMMASAVFLTQTILTLMNWVKKIEKL